MLHRTPLRSSRLPWLVAALVVAVGVAMLLSPRRAAAEWAWCWDDPIIDVNGQLVNIEVGVAGTAEQVRANNVVALMRIYHPEDVKVRIVATTQNFIREFVDIAEADGDDDDEWEGGPIPIKVVVVILSKQPMPAQVRVTTPTGVTTVAATTQSYLTVGFTVQPPARRAATTPAPTATRTPSATPTPSAIRTPSATRTPSVTPTRTPTPAKATATPKPRSRDD